MKPPNCLEIAAAVQAHERTAREVADEALARAEALQDGLRAFTLIAPEIARRQAEYVDRRIGQGEKPPLAGVPFAVKDLFDVAGTPTTYGSRVFRDRIAERDATVVRHLVRAGAVLIGKTNLHECAFGFTGENPVYGDCRNPWNRERIAGGSSSGSAVAVAAGICPLAIGSDTGGSIRQPSALCGLTGLKPTYGRVSREGGLPLSWTMDHVGPMTRTAEEAAVALYGMTAADSARGPGGEIPRSGRDLAEWLGPRGLRIGLPRKWFFDALEPDVAAAVEAAIAEFRNLGAEIVEVELPLLEEALGAHRAIIFAEASSWHRPFLAERPGDYGDDIRALLLTGLFLPAVEYLDALRARRIIRREWGKVFEKLERSDRGTPKLPLLLTPTTPVVATRFGQQTAELPGGAKPLVRAYLDLTLPFNLSGHTAISIPCGFSQDELPIGMQLVGRPFDEMTVLAAAHQYQQATDWHVRTPPPG